MTEAGESVLRFLHLSDIHCTDRNGAGAFDLDSDLRRAICDDVGMLRDQLGAFTGILITGDVAYAASPDEYQKAAGWLDELRTIAGCLKEHIYTVPGNHDVDRSLTEDVIVEAFHNELRSCDPKKIETIINRWLSKENDSNHLLYKPLENYNDFAAQYACSIEPGSLFWDIDGLPLDYGFTLSIRGLTSVFCSNQKDNDGAEKLVLGEMQALMPTEKGRVNLSLCHHPPEWLRDRDRVFEALLAGTHVQLYGHKHRHYLMLSNSSLIVSAGAAHPDREEEWDPRYNILELCVQFNNGKHELVATVYPRRFESRERQFKPDYRDGGEEYETYRILLPSSRESIAVSPPSAEKQSSGSLKANSKKGKASVSSEENSMHPLRSLGYLLVELPSHRLEQIAKNLDLLEDPNVPPKVSRLIQVAIDRDQLEQLWDQAAEVAKIQKANPFRGDQTT